MIIYRHVVNYTRVVNTDNVSVLEKNVSLHYQSKYREISEDLTRCLELGYLVNENYMEFLIARGT